MNNALKEFDTNIKVINDSMAIYNYLRKVAKNIDFSILLRSQYILVVSALDTFMHEIVIEKIIDCFFGKSVVTNVVCDFSFDLVVMLRNKKDYEQRELLRTFLSKKFSKDSFQSPKSIEYAFQIIGINNIWQKVSSDMGHATRDVRDNLAIIVQRRNQIAHESDIDKVNKCYRQISLCDVEYCRDFIQKLVISFSKLL